ncbi:aldo/keto reductase [Glycomyces sp. TRM65418]|uniref:aldo/keto reductase n=1 Tax=Glycomyces sp. TRM65418 TaxID=2867006 RepID=UPI001CE60E2A|nr:aldo/keto reductase [Glycomyces sp. TRM65418]MCC3765090.1 aldo/keto reductase [Glycomyces sp. TRM65418]QZD54719.1 aldo/keto reductase [Glycomyces sp. TRM65418]
MAKLGRTDLDIYPLVLGTNTFGWTTDESEAHAVLDAFTAAGGNLIDTADSYSVWAPGNTGGESEAVIGTWLARRRDRRALVATKVSQHPGFKGLSAANVKAAAEASLKRLGVEAIDLYYAHFDDEDTPLEETVAAFDALVTEGKIRHIGISNYRPERVREWLDIAERTDAARPVALQPKYSLVSRGAFEPGLRDLAVAEDLSAFPYHALASGFLTGKYRTEADLRQSVRGDSAAKHLNPSGLAIIDKLDRIAGSRGVAIASVALAWTRTRPGIAAPIAGARTADQLGPLLASAELDLTAEESEELTALSDFIDA